MSDWLTADSDICVYVYDIMDYTVPPPCEITDQLAVSTQNCFSTLALHALYTNINTSAQNAPKCNIATQKQKNFWGGGTAPPQTYPIGAFGASILAPSALGVPVLFHLQFEPCLTVSQSHLVPVKLVTVNHDKH